MASIRFEGLNALVKGLDERTEIEPVKKIIKHDTASLEQKSKRQTTISFVKGYSTGDTRDSIHLSIKDGGLTGEVEPGTKYSPYVEYGTRYMRAEPFMKPAFNVVSSEFKSHIEKIMK